jgi:uracil-DNA glycosylase family 4
MKTIEQINQKLLKLKFPETLKSATQIVLGDGPKDSKLIFVGEAPGKEEDLTGKPFVGRSGKLLNELLKSIGLLRDQVYITNIVKLRPPDNRDPSPLEKEFFEKYLKAEIAAIKPNLVVTLGRHSLNYFLPKAKISEVHGQIQTDQNGINIFPLYHPAVALYNPKSKVILAQDFELLAKYI